MVTDQPENTPKENDGPVIQVQPASPGSDPKPPKENVTSSQGKVPRENVNTVLFLAQYLHQDPSDYAERMVEYGFSHREFKTAGAKLRADLVKRKTTGVDPVPTPGRSCSSTVEEIGQLLQFANVVSNDDFQYYPDLSDSTIIIDGSRPIRKLDSVEENIEFVTKVVDELKENVDQLQKKLEEIVVPNAVISKSTDLASNNVSLAVPTEQRGSRQSYSQTLKGATDRSVSF